MAQPRSPRNSDTPAPITLNLDTFEEEKGPEFPFVAMVNGRRLEFSNPQELAWQDVMAIDNPSEFARLCLSEEDRKFFLAEKINVRKLNALMSAFRAHYGVGSLGEDDA